MLLEHRIYRIAQCRDFARSRGASLLKISNYQTKFIVYRQRRPSCFSRRDQLRACGAIRALELTSLVQHYLKLLLKGFVSEQGVERLAARDAILFAVAPTIGTCQQMLDAGVRDEQRLFAKEAQPSLKEHESVELLHWVKRQREVAIPYDGAKAVLNDAL